MRTLKEENLSLILQSFQTLTGQVNIYTDRDQQSSKCEDGRQEKGQDYSEGIRDFHRRP